MLKLIKPDVSHKAAVMDFRNEFLDRGERVSGGAGLEGAEDYERWLNGEYTPHYGKVEEAVFLAKDENGGIVGISDVRLGTNDFILQFAGQIGYSVRPSRRGRRYASEILRLTLEEAKKLGFDKILVTCNEPNLASARVIEKNNGTLEKIVPHPGFPNVRRYYFDLSEK